LKKREESAKLNKHKRTTKWMKQKQHVVEKETNPLFSKTDTGQKLWYFLAVFEYYGLRCFGSENTEIPNRT
jgi:cytochrome b subunit of formate dehydrogenase